MRLTGKFGKFDGELKSMDLSVDLLDDKDRALAAYGGRIIPSGVRYPAEPLAIRDLRNLFGKRLTLDDGLRQWCHEYALNRGESLKLQRGFSGDVEGISYFDRLRDYQRTGAQWLAKSGNAMLGDDPGTGKTLQALTAGKLMGARKTLIVAPAYILPVWRRHIEDWLREEAVVGYHVNKKRRLALLSRTDVPYMLTNPESLRGNYPAVFKHSPDHLIVDEAHKFQGRKSGQTNGLMRLIRRSGKVSFLSGSLVWNKPDSLWSLLHLLEPSRFTSYWRFVHEFCAVSETPFGYKILGARQENLERLRWLLSPMLLRRRKQDVLSELPEKMVQTLSYDLTHKQGREYMNLRDKMRLDTADGKNLYFMSGSYNAMRQLLNMPASLDCGKGNPKFDLIKGLVDDTPPPVVVFVWHREYAAYLANELKAVLITGDTSMVERESIVRRFQDGEVAVLVANIASAGMGIDLHRANTAIFAEGAVPGHLNTQAEDRLHRLGQKQRTMIYRIQANNTVESAIWSASNRYHVESEQILAKRYIAESVLKTPLDK